MAVSVVLELAEGNEEENGKSGHRCEENGKLCCVNKNENGNLDDIKENGNPSEENVYFIKENGELSEENERNNQLLLSHQHGENAGKFFKESANPSEENEKKSVAGQLCGVFINFLVSFVLVVRSFKVPQQQLGNLLPLSPVQRQV